MKTMLTRRWLLAGIMAALVTGIAGPAPRPVLAHEAQCPICKLDVVQDTEKLDNEVAIKFGRKRIEYRCVWCALTDAKTYRGDLTILAPSELKGKPVLLARKGEQWTVQPATAVFVGQKVNHRQCQTGYRALTTAAAFNKWVAAHRPLLDEARPLTLAQMLELVK